MKNIILFLACISLIACSQQPSSTTSVEKPTETIDPDSFIVQNIRNIECGFDKQELIRPFLFNLTFKGKIDAQHAIEMNLLFDSTFILSDARKRTRRVSGVYHYENHNDKIVLLGELDPVTKELYLYSEKNNKKDEIFKGKYTDNFESVSGTWEKTSKGKQALFELKKTQQKGANTTLFMQYVFALKLNEILKKNSAENFTVSADSVGVDKNGIYIRNLLTNNTSSFYPNSFSAFFDYESTATYIFYSLDAEIWQMENSELLFVFIDEKSESGDVIQYDEETDEPLPNAEENSFENTSKALWLYKNNSFENILVFDEEQKEADKNYASKISTMEWYATYEKDTLTVFEKKTNKAWIRDSSKEKLILK